MVLFESLYILAHGHSHGGGGHGHSHGGGGHGHSHSKKLTDVEENGHSPNHERNPLTQGLTSCSFNYSIVFNR